MSLDTGTNERGIGAILDNKEILVSKYDYVEGFIRGLAGLYPERKKIGEMRRGFIEEIMHVGKSSSAVEEVFSKMTKSLSAKEVDPNKALFIKEKQLPGFIGEAIVRRVIGDNYTHMIYDDYGDMTQYEEEEDDVNGVDFRLVDKDGREIRVQIKTRESMECGELLMVNVHDMADYLVTDGVEDPERQILSKAKKYNAKEEDKRPDIVLMIGRGRGDALTTSKNLVKKALDLDESYGDSLGVVLVDMLDEMIDHVPWRISQPMH